MGDDRVIARVDKLLRLAAPDSNTSEHERASAALEACRIISENNLSVCRRTVEKKRAARAPRQRATPASKPTDVNNWRQGIAQFDAPCADPECEQAIHAGDPVWARFCGFTEQYIHVGADCGW
jgi:hypothetical protein